VSAFTRSKKFMKKDVLRKKCESPKRYDAIICPLGLVLVIQIVSQSYFACVRK